MSLESTASDAEILCNLKLESMIEILHSQHAIIMSTIWRFVYNDFYKVPKLSMYGGLIIDSYESFFLQILTCAMNLYENRAASTTEDGLPVEVTRIIQMTKNFCIHFDKICEETIRNSYLLNGSKIVDILNCAEFAKIIVNYERISSDNFYAKYSYYFKHSWFIAMPIPKIKDADLCHKIRMMHMRLRRIVLAHNYMFQQQKEYLTEVIVCPSITIKRPGNNVYTGYGDIENRFFYYGVMNDGAYISKFHTDNMNVEYDEHYDEQVINDNEEFNRNPNNIILYNENNELFDEERDFMAHDDNSVNSDVLETLPYLGFKVDVTIRCPIAFAPWKYLNSLTCDEKYRIQRESRSKSGTKIHMDFKCIGARFVRLPQNYQYDEIQRKN